MASDLTATAERKRYAGLITAAWNKALEGILEAGNYLIEAKAKLEHGQYGAMISTDLPFGISTAQRLVTVARDERLSKAAHARLLPPHWYDLYLITKLTDAEFDDAVAHNIIRPDMERRDLSNYFKGERRVAKLADLSESIKKAREKLGLLQYGVIYADPPWRFEPYSRETGMDAAADNHYPTMPTDEISALPVSSAAFEDCVLFLWGTVPMMPQAQQVMEAWGFGYKTHFCWVKDRPGTGYWLRNQHELLLIGTRGKIPAPVSGSQPNSVIEADAEEHSKKPEIFHELIEAWYPTDTETPWHLEMFARDSRPGWDRVGAEAPSEVAA